MYSTVVYCYFLLLGSTMLVFGKTIWDDYEESDICSMLHKLHKIDQNKLDEYCDNIKKNNIHGTCLYECDIEDIKKAMKMTFGDWAVFKKEIQDIRLMIKEEQQKQEFKEIERRDNEYGGMTVSHIGKQVIKFVSRLVYSWLETVGLLYLFNGITYVIGN